MTGNETRRAFLDFFQIKGHLVLPGISLQPTDASALLTVAGVVPFRGVIEGTEAAQAPRVATCQRCVRTIDVEIVGDESHLTFFEMLGNFSFGDYYKRESLLWGYEFLCGVMGLPKDRLWSTIFPGDEEASRVLTQEVGIPAERIVAKPDNFWGPVGETGACGPCSEIFFDLGANVGCGRAECSLDCECGRFLEVWNHVFTELRRTTASPCRRPVETDVPLPHKNIDTGMGFERLVMVAQGVPSVYDTDIFRTIQDAVCEALPAASDAAQSARRRLITDHARCATFLVMDNILPGNEGRGYVLRRLIRRAVRAGKSLGAESAFLHRLVPAVERAMGPGYPQLAAKLDYITAAIHAEEDAFFHVLQQGLKRLDEVLKGLPGTVIPGEEVFRLHDSYGFPLEITREVAAERGLTIDEAGFQAAMEAQRRRGQEHGATADTLGKEPALLGLPKTEFLGYDALEAPARVLATIKEGAELVLDRTPFYGESGGQVGDTGLLRVLDAEGAHGKALRVVDTQKAGDLLVHVLSEPAPDLMPGTQVDAMIDGERRAAIRRAHTATHLLQAALRQVLGTHVQQAGSLVEPDRLRFDFSHFAPLTPAQAREVEDLVNRKVLEDLPVDVRARPYQEAITEGAMALFGEKYGSEVRTVRAGDFSLELCGGTHVERTGWIGLLKISNEASVGAGLRRIEASTGLGSLAALRQASETVSAAAALLNAPPAELVARVRGLQGTARELERQVSELRRHSAASQLDALLAQAVELDGTRVLAADAGDVDAEGLKALADAAAERLRSAVVLLHGAQNGRGSLVCKVTDDLTPRGAHAGHLIREVARTAGGSGGGRAEFAQGAARDRARVPEALQATLELVRNQLSRTPARR